MTLMATNTHPAPRQKPANISDPPKFSGKREDLEEFKNMVNIKLTGNVEQFPSDQHRLAYVLRRRLEALKSNLDSGLYIDIGSRR